MKTIVVLVILHFVSHCYSQTFDYQKHIQINETASAYVFNLSEDVYRHVKHKNLSDIRITNADGDLVPMRIMKAGDTIEYEYTQTSLPLFKINQTIGTNVSTKQVRTTRFGQSENYTVKTSKSFLNYLKTEETQQDNVFYIDATSLNEHKIASLILDWEFLDQGNRVFYLELQASNDLTNWNTLYSRKKMLDIHIANKHVLENKLLLNHQTYAYYRLTFHKPPYPQITQVTAQLTSQEIHIKNKILSVRNLNIETVNEVKFQLDGHFSIESMKIDFNQKNLITNVRLYSKQREKDKWKFIKQDMLYSLEYQGDEISENILHTNPSNHRFWRLVFDKNVNNNSLSKIDLGWRPHHVQFIAQGEAPYTLVYGNSKIKRPADSYWYHKLPVKLRSKMFSSNVQLIDAVETKQVTINNHKKPLLDKTNQKQWVFWGLLVLILILLIRMASKLLSEVKGKQ